MGKYTMFLSKSRIRMNYDSDIAPNWDPTNRIDLTSEVARFTIKGV